MRLEKLMSLFLVLILLAVGVFNGLSISATADESNNTNPVLEELKAAWQEMTVPVSSDFLPFAYHKDGKFPGNLLTYATYNADTAPYGATYDMVGKQYIYDREDSTETNFKTTSSNGQRYIGFFQRQLLYLWIGRSSRL